MKTIFSIFVCFSIAFTAIVSSHAAIFTVDNVSLDLADSDTNDGICSTLLGGCTLRAAIEQANVSSGIDTINFNVPGVGPYVIQPTSGLPNITDAVIIDGTTQFDSNGNPQIVLDGSLLINESGLRIVNVSGGNTIKGLVIQNFTRDNNDNVAGIYIAQSNGNLIEGNRIGTDYSGTSIAGNTWGLFLDYSPNNIIKNNLINGSTEAAGIILLSSNGTIIDSNVIGTDITGALDLGNGSHGIAAKSSSLVVIQNNLISNNGRWGISVDSINSSISDFIILGNIITQNLDGGIEIVRNPSVSTSAVIVFNSIFNNGELGIDLGNYSDGVTLNDLDDVDTFGGNHLQNFPIIDQITFDDGNGQSVIDASLNTQSGSYYIEFFDNEACDPSGYGEGKTLLTNVTINIPSGSTNANFSVVVPQLTTGHFITATATLLDLNGDPVETSEFSQCVEVVAPAPNPSPTATPISITEICDNGADDDGDAQIDCEDADCAGSVLCVSNETPCEGENCNESGESSNNGGTPADGDFQGGACSLNHNSHPNQGFMTLALLLIGIAAIRMRKISS